MKKINKNLTRFAYLLVALMVGSVFGSPLLAASLLIAPTAFKFVGLSMPSGLAFQTLIDPTDLTWNGKEAMSISEAVYVAAFSDSQAPLSQFHSIQTGIKAKQQIPFLGTFGLVGKKKSACNVTANSGQMVMTEKFWLPAYVTDRLKDCWATTAASFFTWANANGIKKENLDGTDYANFLKFRLGESVADATWRLTWFGATDADTSSNAGTLSSGTDAEFFKPVDGLFKQIFAVVAADSTRKLADTGNFASNIGLTTKNSQTTYALQAFNSTDTTNKLATTLLQKLTTKADMRLRQDKSGMILVTQSIMDQYFVERSAANLESGVTILENGLSMVKVNGVPVYAVPFWDRYIDSYYDSGAKWYLPHRAVYTTPSNIPIGLEEEANLSELDAFYDKVNKDYIIDFGFNFDVKFLQSYMGYFAY